MKSFDELMTHKLQDLYDAEQQIINALPQMAEASDSSGLSKAFETHLEETKNQIKRLETIGESMKISLHGKHCAGMAGLLQEGEEIMSEGDKSPVRDAALIAAAQAVEHYEIAGYGTAIEYAKLIENEEAEKLLKETLDEEKSTDQKLTELAKKSINKKAQQTMGDMAYGPSI